MENFDVVVHIKPVNYFLLDSLTRLFILTVSAAEETVLYATSVAHTLKHQNNKLAKKTRQPSQVTEREKTTLQA